jgi:hypothetical protein
MSPYLRLLFFGLMLLPPALTQSVAYAQQVPATPTDEQPEVLTRGPVHEAFAEPVGLESDGGLVAPKPPPSDINEEPPAQRPEGNNFVWVPGYWGWDADRDDYIWVSACWRVAPPGMFWLPGYWTQAPAGWRWVSGAWRPTGTQDIQYLPEPPAMQQEPPPGAAPSADYVWVPPCQYWTNGQYVLRRGYWLEQQPDWVWVPSNYVWTPHGFMFVAGHWDYVLDQRGVLFAPVYFPRATYLRAGFVYSPAIVVDIGLLSVNLFAYPRYHHYYFGDYYDSAYISMGIYPRFEVGRYHGWYDPIYEYDRWHHGRADARWEERERHDYEERREHAAERPPRTWHEMEEREAAHPHEGRNEAIARPLSTVAAEKGTWKYQHVDDSSRERIATQTRSETRFRDERTKWESPTPAAQAQPASSRDGHTQGQGEEQSRQQGQEQSRQQGQEQSRQQGQEQSRQQGQEQSRAAPAAAPAQHETAKGQPERVDIPKPPIQGPDPASTSKGDRPPPRPADERRRSQGGQSHKRKH